MATYDYIPLYAEEDIEFSCEEQGDDTQCLQDYALKTLVARHALSMDVLTRFADLCEVGGDRAEKLAWLAEVVAAFERANAEAAEAWGAFTGAYPPATEGVCPF